MTANPARLRKYIQSFGFEDLFIEELGWDRYRDRLEVVINGDTVTLHAFAQKRGMVAFSVAMIPDNRMRRKIEQQVAKVHRENIIIYTDFAQTQQIWQWVRRETGKPLANRERQFHKGQSGENIAQILSVIAFSLDEEDDLTIVDVTSRVRAAFDVERVTKRFYDRFKRQHDAFLAFIEGIPDEDFQRWYASVMLNRIMFIYFVQRKGFLDGDTDYLRNRLVRTDGNFYRDFLCPLFFEGFAKKEHTPAIRGLLGDVPYLNGGLFLQHQIEELYGAAIQIENEAFEKLFDFFDEYHWHLDERPLRDDNEINPDVLGYIFEKYINQKQMGAYYTKEDITEYISKNTVIPFLFDAAREDVAIAFEGEHTVWDLLVENPDRYIYPAVRHGAELALPQNIAAGLDEVSQRGEWNTPAPPEYGLPTEIWREVVARRRRYEDVRAKLERGEVRQINDLITLNLDIQQFAQDVIDFTDSPDVIRAFWKAINRVTVLDPTCGSGAFLFAALNILEPLYEACLERMEAFVAELAHTGDNHPQKYSDFRQVMARIDQHPNRRYFILKSIVIQNLYGVDIMEEAVEIAKLRLFLKLVAQVDDRRRIEPLPDIDFNIRAGNTLVGFATEREFKGRLFAQSVLPRMETLKSTVELFRREQLNDVISAEEMQQLKGNVNRVLKEITDLLDDTLMQDYGLSDLAAFRRSHQPFHWFVEFYGVLKNGGFDVIIGNPPYVQYHNIKKEYTVQDYATEPTRNLFALTSERVMQLGHPHGLTGLILPISAICTRLTAPLQSLLQKQDARWYSGFDVFPARIFEGAAQRVAILIWLNSRQKLNSTLFTSRYYRWYQEERSSLMSMVYYQDATDFDSVGWTPRLYDRLSKSALDKVNSNKKIGRYRAKSGTSPIYAHRIINNFIKAVDFAPYFKKGNGEVTTSDDFKALYIAEEYRQMSIAILNSSTFYWYWRMHGDGFHCGYSDIDEFPITLEALNNVLSNNLETLARQISTDLNANSEIRVRNQKRTGRVELQTFFVGKSKHIIDEIDQVLARHYGFTDEELDFIINYDIKYRMGDDLGGEEGEED